jgi:DNA modification methylase
MSKANALDRIEMIITEQDVESNLPPIIFPEDCNTLTITETNVSIEGEQENRAVDPRNSLNDLTGKEWLPETKSFFFQKGLGAKHPHAQIERKHPAPYSFQDISRLVLFFTKTGDIVLDPFGGIGSTAKACALSNRRCTSIELSSEWHELSLERLETEVAKGSSLEHTFINDDCIPVLKAFDDESFDFMVTSPPYWAILNKKADHKVKKGRVDQKLATNYSSKDNDLGNIESYEEFLYTLVNDVFKECGRVLKEKKYMCIVVSDFRNKSEFISFHSDLIQRLSHIEVGRGCELTLQGVKILAQNHKSLLPYGYPFAYVENIHHQYILIFRRTRKSNKR